jgi:magnesium-transporting ATPase (P-type)
MIRIILQNLSLMIVGIIIAIVGLIIQQTRAYYLIAGYNTLPAEKQKTVNIKLVAKALRNAFLLLGVVWICIPIISDLLGFHKLKFWLLIGLHFMICILLIVIVNTQEKYKTKNQKNKQLQALTVGALINCHGQPGQLKVI